MTIPKEVVQRRLNNSIKESLDLVKRVCPEFLEDYGYCLAFLRQILQHKFDMDLERYEDDPAYTGTRYPAQD